MGGKRRGNFQGHNKERNGKERKKGRGKEKRKKYRLKIIRSSVPIQNSYILKTRQLEYKDLY